MRELGIIPDGAMLVRGSIIEAVGTRLEIKRLAPPRVRVVDADDKIVLPGFVDAHTHPVFAGNRSDEFEERIAGATYSQIAARGGGIQSTVRRTREASEQELLEAGRRYREWFLQGGTTTVEAKSGYGLSLQAEQKLLRVIRTLSSERIIRFVPTFLGAHEIPPEFQSTRNVYIDLVIREMLPRIRRERLARFCDVFCEPSVFPTEDARRILLAASNLGYGLRIHADQLCRSGGSRLAADLRVTTADHLEHSSEDDFRALQEANVQPVLLPASVYALGSKSYPNARKMIEMGLALVLATDFNPGSSPTTSMSLVLSLACTQMRTTPAEAITASTINPAYSLGLGENVGSLEKGKSADFVIHDCEDYRELAYFFGRESADSVYFAGRPQFSRRRIVTPR
jgi:imidazolonepropionase